MIALLINPDYITARELLLNTVMKMETERVGLENCPGRVLAEDFAARESVPAFDRSPYDGYAFIAKDTEGASRENPVTLQVLETVAAGAVPEQSVTAGTAIKLMTGAPLPQGADAIVKFEDTVFTNTSVTLFKPFAPGENVVRAGEDVRPGQVLVQAGHRIDAGTLGTLAAQGEREPLVYKVPVVGIISTGDEVMELDELLSPGKIRNTNRYTLYAMVEKLGCRPVYLGKAGDDTADISRLIVHGLKQCHVVLLTGGVSVGDFDLTPKAMEHAGVELLFSGVSMKPGMACAYGVKNGRLVCGLSGNPASSMTNFCAVAMPALRTLMGLAEAVPQEIKVTLKNGFRKKSPATRFLRGKLDLTDGSAKMELSEDQGNVILSSAIGCDVMAVVPAGSPALEPGTVLKGFLI